MTNSLLLKMAIEIVDLPIDSMVDLPVRYVAVYQRVSWNKLTWYPEYIIGLVEGKILTGNHGLFPIKYRGFLQCFPYTNPFTLTSTSSTAQGGGGSFKNRKPIGEIGIGCCESGMAERIHWWTERCLRSPLFLSLSLTIYLPTSLSSMYLSIYRSIYLSLSLFHLITYLPIYLSISLSLSLSFVYLSSCLPVCLSICLSVYLSICGAVSFSVM